MREFANDYRATGGRMTFSVKTIPDMLVEAYGNQTEVARKLKCSRNTIRKYVDDKDGKMHAIVNDVLMVHRGWSERDALLRKN
jgi:hypothetical protein